MDPDTATARASPRGVELAQDPRAGGSGPRLPARPPRRPRRRDPRPGRCPTPYPRPTGCRGARPSLGPLRSTACRPVEPRAVHATFPRNARPIAGPPTSRVGTAGGWPGISGSFGDLPRRRQPYNITGERCVARQVEISGQPAADALDRSGPSTLRSAEDGVAASQRDLREIGASGDHRVQRQTNGIGWIADVQDLRRSSCRCR